MCANPHCRRTLKEDGPSLYYCSVICAAAATDRENAQRYINRVVYGARPPNYRDPCAWDTRSANPKTQDANIAEAFSWLDVRAPQ